MTLSITLSHQFSGFNLDVRLKAPAGLTALFGRSGAGKTTIINAVSGLLTPQSGQITLNNHTLLNTSQQIAIPPHKRRIGYIFQDARLFPHLTINQNLLYGRWFARTKTADAETSRIIDMLGLGPLLSRRPGTLSGGEKQRVAIGRALIMRPDMILADEPLAALDEQRKSEILPYFERLRDEGDIPILYVSHSMAEVARLATTLVMLDAGKITQQGPTQDVLADPMYIPAGIRSVGAILQARVLAHHPDGLTELNANGAHLFVPKLTLEKSQEIRLRIAAQDVLISLSEPKGISALNVLPGRVEGIRSGEGPGAIVTLQTKAGIILARITQRSVKTLSLEVGTQCYAIVKTVSIAPEDIGNSAD